MKSEYFLFRLKSINLLTLILEEPEKALHYYAQKINLTYSHASNVMNIFIKDELVMKNLSGRSNLLHLTKKGRELIEFIKNWRENFGKL